MQRIPPSQRVRQRIAELLADGTEADEEMVTTIVRLGVERLIQEMLEEEVKDYLGRDHYVRRAPDQEHLGYRNGYEPGRIRTGEGEVTVQVPQVRDTPKTYRSELMVRPGGDSDALRSSHDSSPRRDA